MTSIYNYRDLDQTGSRRESVGKRKVQVCHQGQQGTLATFAPGDAPSLMKVSKSHHILLANGARAFINDDQIEVVTARPGRAVTGKIKTPGVTKRLISKHASQSQATKIPVHLEDVSNNNVNVCMPEIVNLVSEDPFDVLPVLPEQDLKKAPALTSKRPLTRIQVTRRSSNNNQAGGKSQAQVFPGLLLL